MGASHVNHFPLVERRQEGGQARHVRLVHPMVGIPRLAVAPFVAPADAIRARFCAHWPLHGPDSIRAAAATLRALSQVWDRAEELIEISRFDPVACLDVSVVDVDGMQLDILLLKGAQVPDGAQALAQNLADLAHDYVSVREWLARSAQSTCDGVKDAGLADARPMLLRDDHRVIARDWLGADMNALLGWLLQRAAAILLSVDLSPDAIHSDLLGARAFKAPLLAAASLLERASGLAVECAAFVEDFDRRWLAMRDAAAAAAALYPVAGKV